MEGAFGIVLVVVTLIAVVGGIAVVVRILAS